MNEEVVAIFRSDLREGSGCRFGAWEAGGIWRHGLTG